MSGGGAKSNEYLMSLSKYHINEVFNEYLMRTLLIMIFVLSYLVQVFVHLLKVFVQ